MASLHDGHAIKERVGTTSAKQSTNSRVTDRRNISVLLLLHSTTRSRPRLETIQHPVDDDPSDRDVEPDRKRPLHEAYVAEDSTA